MDNNMHYSKFCKKLKKEHVRKRLFYLFILIYLIRFPLQELISSRYKIIYIFNIRWIALVYVQ